MDSIRVLIVDDHPFYREGVRTMLSVESGIEIAGELASGDEVVAQAANLQPDVILMDIKMPGINGIEATRRILHTSPHIGVLVLTMFEADETVFAAMRAGARGYLLKDVGQEELVRAVKAVNRGYLLKDVGQEELVRAVKAVNRGEAIFSPAIAQRLIHYFAALRPMAADLVFPELTDREREVLQLIAQGTSNVEIAERLVLRTKTVQNHVSNIFSKLQVADRAQAIVRAREAGLGLERNT